ncbi:MAG: hypothetical protein R3B07_26105 [Polyangiaceae bacterium]
MTLRRLLPRGGWVLLGVLLAERFGAGLFQRELVERATAAGLSRLDASVVSVLARFWALPGFALGALVSWFWPRAALGLGLALCLSGALYSMRGGCDWRVVSAVVVVGSACSLLAVFASLAAQLRQARGVTERMAPVALFVSVEHLAALLTPKIGGFGGWAGAACWALGLALSLLVARGSTPAMDGGGPATRRGQAWLGAGALVIFGAILVPNSLATPGEFEASRALVFEWALCLGLLALSLFRAAWLSAWRALLVASCERKLHHKARSSPTSSIRDPGGGSRLLASRELCSMPYVCRVAGRRAPRFRDDAVLVLQHRCAARPASTTGFRTRNARRISWSARGAVQCPVARRAHQVGAPLPADC